MKTYFYKDELNDDFAFTNIKEQKEIADDYKYISNNLLYKFVEFIVYRIIMTPIAFLMLKFSHVKVKNKKVLKKVKGGYFLYGNHTQRPNDAYIPSSITFPKKSYIIVNPDAISIKGISTFVKMAGAMPIPNNIKGLINFQDSVIRRSKHNAVVIFPEAHIWPYYTKIRPYKATSFKYPSKINAPSFSFTTTYQKRRHSKKPNIIVYVDGPFYPKMDLNIKDREIELKNRIHYVMELRSTYSNYEYIKYEKID